MNSELSDRLIAEVHFGGRAYIRNLAAAEAAVVNGQFNVAKVLRAAAHTQRSIAMQAARFLVEDIDATHLFQTILSELNHELLMGEYTPTSEFDNSVQAGLEQLKTVKKRLKDILSRSLASLNANSDILESDISQFLWGCYGCGYIYEDEHPDTCSICGAFSIEFEWFGPFYAGTPEHLGQLSPTKILSILNTIPDKVAASITDVNDVVLRHKPTEQEWCVKEIVGHIIETDRLFTDRVRIVLESQGIATIPRTIPPWLLHEGKGYEDLPANELIARLREARMISLDIVQHLEPKQWTRSGVILGKTVSILDLGSWLANHDRGHLSQIQQLCGN